MQAFVLERYGAPLRELSVPEPVPGPHEVLVRMVASGANHADERTRVGEFKAICRLNFPKVMGGELSGEVIGVGGDVTGFVVGDRVYGYTGVVGMGTWAEIVAVDAAALALREQWPALYRFLRDNEPASVHGALTSIISFQAWLVANAACYDFRRLHRYVSSNIR